MCFLPTGSDETEVLGVGSIPVEIPLDFNMHSYIFS